MLFKRLLSSLACAAVVTACATPPPAPKPPPTIAALMAGAEAAIRAGKNDDAVAWLKSAIATYPADKTPRVRMAQLQFEVHNYGEAITHAQAALNRDPDDMVAHSMVAVAGLRVSSKALTDLASKNNLTGDVRSEAQSLVKLLRTNIGGDLIPPVKSGRPVRSTAVKPTAAAAPKTANGDTPADWLNH